MTRRRAARARVQKDDKPDVDKESRRVILRRNRGGFSNSGLSSATDDEGIPRDINEAVRQVASTPPRQAAPAQPVAAPSTGEIPDDLQSIANNEDYSPLARLQQVGRRSSEYEREYRLGLLHRLLMRNVPLDEIAAQLQISVSQVLRDRRELRERLRSVARDLNIDEMVGHNTGVYEEVVAMALRAASASRNPLPMRLAAMRTALAGQNDMHRFYQAAGVYDVLRFRRLPGADGASDIQRMLALTEELMAENNREQRQAENPNPLGEFSGSDNNNNL
jgi:hypothetical protein